MKEDFFKKEYAFDHVSVKSLWRKISTAEGLSDWFAQSVEIEDNQILFDWGKNLKEEATILKKENRRSFIWRWEDGNRPYKLSLVIDKAEISGLVYLNVEDEELQACDDESVAMWENHIERLKKSLGLQ